MTVVTPRIARGRRLLLGLYVAALVLAALAAVVGLAGVVFGPLLLEPGRD
ncbi:hypothetical protein [Streptomyces sp. NPDC012888]